MISGCIGYGRIFSKTQILIGVLQAMTALFIFGWVWSIVWGWKMLFLGITE